YTYEVCNTGDYCDTKCPQPLKPAEPKVWCAVTSSENGLVIQGKDCQNNYCLYVGVTSYYGDTVVTRSCTPFDSVLMIDGRTATANNLCYTTTINGVQYSYEVCNNGNYCDTHCSGSSHSLLLALLLLPLTYLLKH
ncbi:hypothetical protein PFISCL1PPCAC_7008, partial [Pristionchus fissidentatus]